MDEQSGDPEVARTSRVSIVVTSEERAWLLARASRLRLGGGPRMGAASALQEIFESARARERRPLARLLRRLGWSR